jgi:hypothetical protein
MKLFLLLSLFLTTAFAETKPLREVSVIVTKEGYYPKSISVFEGDIHCRRSSLHDR